MSVEVFSKLREIESLTKVRNKYLSSKKEQEDRVSVLNNRRQEHDLQTAKLKQDLISIQSELVDTEKNLGLITEQRQRLIDYGGDEKKIKDFLNQITTLEDKGLKFLDEIESLENQLKDAKAFSEGIQKTISEIQEEVNLDTAKITVEIKNLDQRLSLLLEELPLEFKALLLKISSKNLAHGPFTRVDQGSCFFCRFKISRLDESEIDMQKILKTCLQCSRIFLPYGV